MGQMLMSVVVVVVVSQIDDGRNSGRKKKERNTRRDVMNMIYSISNTNELSRASKHAHIRRYTHTFRKKSRETL